MVVEKPFELNREAPPPAVPDRDLETEKSRPLRRDDGTRWSPRARVLYGCAAVVAVIVGVIPALWINRSREPEVAGAAPRSETAAPQVAAPAPAAEAPASETAPVATEDIEIAPREPTVPVAPRASAEKTVKSARTKGERSKPPARPKKATPPPCDVYLHPKGCPR